MKIIKKIRLSMRYRFFVLNSKLQMERKTGFNIMLKKKLMSGVVKVVKRYVLSEYA